MWHSLIYRWCLWISPKKTGRVCCFKLLVIFSCLRIARMKLIWLNQTKMRLLSASDFECIIHAIIVSVSAPVLNVSFSFVRVKLPRQFMFVQNARLFTGTGRRSHITPNVALLHWLPFNFQIVFKIILIVITCKTLYGFTPAYTRSKAMWPYTRTRPSLGLVGDLILLLM